MAVPILFKKIPFPGHFTRQIFGANFVESVFLSQGKFGSSLSFKSFKSTFPFNLDCISEAKKVGKRKLGLACFCTYLLCCFLIQAADAKNAAGGGLTLSTQHINFNHKPEGKDLRIQTTAQWHLSTEASWVSFSRFNGTGNSTVQIKVNTNNAVEKREAKVVIKAGNSYDTLAISQEGQPATLVASPSQLQIGRHGQQYEVKVVANLPWQVQGHEDWIHIDQIKSDLLGKVVFTVEPAQGTPRSGKLSLSAGTRTFDIVIEQGNVVTSTENELVLAELSIYPNPARDFIMVEGEVEDFQLSDLTGKMIARGKAGLQESLRIETGHFPKGLYLLQLSTSKGIGIKRMVIE